MIPATEGSAERAGRLDLIAIALALLTGAILLVVCFKALTPFIGSLLWAAVLTVATWPLAEAVEARLGGHRKVVALLIGTGCFIILAMPLIYLSATVGTLLRDAWQVLLHVADQGLPEPPAVLARIPLVGVRLVRAWQQDIRNLPALLTDMQSVLVTTGQVILYQYLLISP